MNISQLAQKLDDLGVNRTAYRVGVHGQGNSDAIVLEETPKGFEVYYTERGHNSPMASFANEDEACDYALEQLTKDESMSAHNVGVFDTEDQATALANELRGAGVKVKTDSIPMTADSKRYRVFVFGRDIDKVREIRGW
jgi:hypothetical protein